MNKLEHPCAAWRCPHCSCREYARVDELKVGHFSPGPNVRCVECKAVSEHPCAETGAAVSAWRDIESAPRDGTSVLLLIDGTAQQGCYTGPSDGAIYSRSASVYNWFSEATQTTEHDSSVEGWMPLPPPPSSHDGLREGSGSAQSQPSADKGPQPCSLDTQHFDGEGA